VWRGSTPGDKYVHIPLTLPGVLYGQNVTVDSITIYYQCANGADDYISTTELNKQNSDGTFAVLVNNTTDRTSNSYTGYVLAPTAENALSANEGILMLRLYLHFVDDTSSIKIGGVRLRLSHR
jgi:hypothetical protein